MIYRSNYWMINYNQLLNQTISQPFHISHWVSLSLSAYWSIYGFLLYLWIHMYTVNFLIGVFFSKILHFLEAILLYLWIHKKMLAFHGFFFLRKFDHYYIFLIGGFLSKILNFLIFELVCYSVYGFLQYLCIHTKYVWIHRYLAWIQRYKKKPF